MAFFHRLAPGAIAGELQRAFATSSASLGLLAATYFYIYFAMQVPSGILADTLGPRKLFTAGALVAGIGSALFGLAPDFDLALAGRFLVGLGVSVAFISVLKLNAAWFPERRFATMTGLLMFLGNMGGLLSAVPLVGLALDLASRGSAHTLGDWRLGFAVLFAFALLGWLSTFFVAETRCRNIYREPA